MRSETKHPGGKATAGTNAPLGLRLMALGGILFLHVPLLFILLYAFSSDEKTFQFPPPGLTLRWFSVAVHQGRDPDAQCGGERHEGADAGVAARGLDLDHGAAADSGRGGERVDGHPPLLAQCAHVAADGGGDVLRGLHTDSLPDPGG